VSHTHDPVNAMTQFTESRDTQAGNDKMLNHNDMSVYLCGEY